MDLDFGYDPSKTGNNTGEGNENGNGGTSTPLHKTALHWLALHRAVDCRTQCGTQNAFPEEIGQSGVPVHQALSLIHI